MVYELSMLKKGIKAIEKIVVASSRGDWGKMNNREK